MSTLPAISTPTLPREYYIPTGVPDAGTGFGGTTYTIGPSGASVNYDYEGTDGTGLGTQLQTALNALVGGDKLIVTARHPDTGAVLNYYTGGTFQTHYHTGTSYIVVISDTANNGTLVPFGTRVDPIDAPYMPVLSTSIHNNPTWSFRYDDSTSGGGDDLGSHHWYICGLKFTNHLSVNRQNSGMVYFGGDPGVTAYKKSHLASYCVLDRCWLDAPMISSTYGHVQATIIVCGHHIAIVNNYIRGATSCTSGVDAQGIQLTKGIGPAENSPVSIINNFVEGESECINTGGADVNLDDNGENCQCSDIYIAGNFVAKDLRRWHCVDEAMPEAGVTYDANTRNGTIRLIKNLIEFKHGHRVLVEGNYFRHCPAEDTQHWTLVLTPRSHTTSTGRTPATGAWVLFCTNRDMTFQ